MLAIALAIFALARVISFSLKDPKFRGLLFFAVGLIALGTFFYHRYEHWSYLDSIYFCVVTLATVGYGDFVPTTVMGKVFTIFYIIFGIGTFLVFVNAIIGGVQERQIEKREKKRAARKDAKKKGPKKKAA